MIGYAKKIEKIIRESAFDKKKKKPRLKFNPGLALIGVQTTGPRCVTSIIMCKKWEGKWKGKLVQLNPDFFNLSGRGKLAKLLEGLKNLGLCVTWKGKKVLIEIMGH